MIDLTIHPGVPDSADVWLDVIVLARTARAVRVLILGADRREWLPSSQVTLVDGDGRWERYRDDRGEERFGMIERLSMPAWLFRRRFEKAADRG